MKKLLAVLLSLALMLGAAGAVAEETHPLLDLYDTVYKLLFNTENVTLQFNATFALDGTTFKTAYLTQIQDQDRALRDLRMITPVENDTRESGYTIVTEPDMIYSYESISPHPLCVRQYYVESMLPKHGMLRHTLGMDSLTAALRFAVAGVEPSLAASCTVNKAEDGSAQLTVDLNDGTIPASIQPVLNLALQHFVLKYNEFNLAEHTGVPWASIHMFDTVTNGILFTMRDVALTELHFNADLNDLGALTNVTGSATVRLTEGSGETHQIGITFTAAVYDYGTSAVTEDPVYYDHWYTEPVDCECE